jgi:lipopolysaccharide export system permease protein
MTSGDFTMLGEQAWAMHSLNRRNGRERLFRLQAEPWRRWANGFSCFCFCIVGVPLAVKLKKGDFLTTFFLCFVPILVFYYPLMAMGVDRAKSGDFPPYAVWLGNVIAIAIGLWLMRSVERQ